MPSPGHYLSAKRDPADGCSSQRIRARPKAPDYGGENKAVGAAIVHGKRSEPPLDDPGDSRVLWHERMGSVVAGFPGTIADELQLFLIKLIRVEIKTCQPRKLYYLRMVSILICCPPELELGFRPKTSRSGALMKNLTIERYE